MTKKNNTNDETVSTSGPAFLKLCSITRLPSVMFSNRTRINADRHLNTNIRIVSPIISTPLQSSARSIQYEHTEIKSMRFQLWRMNARGGGGSVGSLGVNRNP